MQVWIGMRLPLGSVAVAPVSRLHYIQVDTVAGTDFAE